MTKPQRTAKRHLELKYKRLFPDTGDRLWAFRESHGLTQKEMAEDSDLSAGCLSRIECGYTQGMSKTLHKLARSWGVSVDYLLNVSDDQEIHNATIPRRKEWTSPPINATDSLQA